MTERGAHRPRRREIIGWRELVGLPDLGIAELPAKIDTGARTSALHAEDQLRFERAGDPWVQFRIPSQTGEIDQVLEAPLIDEREIKNTGGIPELRLIIKTTLLLGRHRWKIEMSLADRRQMEFDLILGRSALRSRGLLINPNRSFTLGQPGTVLSKISLAKF